MTNAEQVKAQLDKSQPFLNPWDVIRSHPGYNPSKTRTLGEMVAVFRDGSRLVWHSATGWEVDNRG